MNKQEFLDLLGARLSGLPRQEVDDRLSFYSEMIDDRIEEGLSEEQAISEIGSVDAIAEQITADIPLIKIATERMRPKRELKTWEIVLLAAGAPIWIPLAITALSVVLSLYLALWSVIISLWSVFASFIACAIAGVVSGCVIAFGGNSLAGLALIAAGLICTGLAILSFFGCRAATDGVILLAKKAVLGIKKCFVKKEEA